MSNVMNSANSNFHMAEPKVGDFQIVATDGAARTGRLHLSRGVVHTPVFMPVGTYGSVKAMLPQTLRELGATIVLGNTYHLWLRPGTDIIRSHGGLSPFMGWHGPVLTDSGGYQVFSLGNLRKLTEQGARFRSPIDGSLRLLTPELATEIQHHLDSDIQMVLDECPPYPSTHEKAADSLALSLRWAERCRETHVRLQNHQLQFGIQQGSLYDDLRAQSIAALTAMGFHGYALGGLAVGEPREEREKALAYSVPLFPANKPRYLMGVGTPLDLIDAVTQGVDMFDCVLPTRNARNGWLYTARGILKIRNAVHRQETAPIEEGCLCMTCRTFSRAYLHHIQRCNDPLAAQLATHHNLYFYLQLMASMREHIAQGTFHTWAAAFRDNWIERPKDAVI